MKLISMPNSFRADDDSTLMFSDHDSVTLPDTLPAVRVGHICLVKGRTEQLAVASLSHLRSVRCGTRGVPAGGRGAGWSSASVFSVYRYQTSGADGDHAVIGCMSGLGPRLFVVDQLESGATFATLAATLSETVLWDVCSAIVGTCDESFKQGQNNERTVLFQAFAEGRMKRRKGPDGIRVTVK
jgi:hypothetical protein